MTFVSKLKSYFYAILYFLLVFALQKDRLWSYKCEKATADVSLKKAPDLFQAIPDLFQAIVEKLDKPEKICFICKKQLSKVLFFYKEKQIINVSVEEKKELDKIFQRKIPHQFSPGYLQKIISSMFIAQGFWNCKTDSTIDKQNQLIVTITKGPRFIISDITIDEHFMKVVMHYLPLANKQITSTKWFLDQKIVAQSMEHLIRVEKKFQINPNKK